CARYHAVDEAGSLVSLASAGPAPISAPTTGATTPATTESEVPQTSPAQAASQPASRPLAGIVTVDMVSRIDANELLLNRVFILAAGLLAGTLAGVAFYLITTRLIRQPVRLLQETAETV